MKAAAGAGYALATDLADWIVQDLQIALSAAHHITGRLVEIEDGVRDALIDAGAILAMPPVRAPSAELGSSPVGGR
jgi:argininosuccinate lyase